MALMLQTTIIDEVYINNAISIAEDILKHKVKNENNKILAQKIQKETSKITEGRKKEKDSRKITEIMRDVKLTEEEEFKAFLLTSKENILAKINFHINEVHDWANNVSFRDMRGAKTISQIYIELDTYLMPLRTHISTKERLNIKPLQLAIFDKTNHCVILGQPGAGKTTSMKKLCFNLLQDVSHSNKEYNFPILIRFRDFNGQDANQSLIGKISDTFDFEISDYKLDHHHVSSETLSLWHNEILISALDMLKPIIILEGFDEISTHEDKQKILTEVRLLTSKLKKSKIILTCRTGEFNYHLDNTDTFEISSLTDQQISLFATRWILDKEKALKFVDDIKNSPFSDTVIKPLSLAHLCAIYERIGTIPDRPKTVYRKVVSLMLEEWDEQRSIIRKSKYSKFESDRKLEFLSHLAFYLTSKRYTVFTQPQLIEAYTKICKNFSLPEDQSVDTANELESHTGLLLQTGFQQYEFAHKSLQEYLTAEYLVKLPSLRLISSKIEILGAELAVATSISSNPSLYFSEIVLGIFNRADLKPSFYYAFISRLIQERPDFYSSPEISLASISLLSNSPNDDKLINLISTISSKNDFSIIHEYYAVKKGDNSSLIYLKRKKEHLIYKLKASMQIPKEILQFNIA